MIASFRFPRKIFLKDIVRFFGMFHLNQNALEYTFLIMVAYILFDSL